MHKLIKIKLKFANLRLKIDILQLQTIVSNKEFQMSTTRLVKNVFLAPILL